MNQQIWQNCLTKTASITEALHLYKEAASGKKEKNRKEKGLLMRGIGASAGTGMALGSLPVMSAMANPYHNVYHGTNLNSADLIFNNELEDGFRGLSTQFAGQAGRLNEKMLANTAIKSMYDLGIPLTEDQEINIVDKAMEKMDGARGTGKFNSVDAVLSSAQEELAKTLEPEQVNSVLDSIKDNVVKSGKRIYTSTGPATVSEWAGKETEPDMFVRKIFDDPAGQLKLQGKGMLNMLTGGIYPELKQAYNNFKFTRAANKVRSNVDRDQTAKLLSALNSGQELDPNDLRSLGISADQYKELSTLASEGRLGASIGTRLPVGEAAMLNDFPGLNAVMAINPGIKHTAGDILPNMDPSRDLSVASDIPLEHFRSLDFVDTETGKPIRRMMLNNPGMPKVTAKGLGKGLLKASPYAAIAALGADLAQSNIRNEDMFIGRGLNAGYGKLKSLMGKEAGIFSGSTRRGLQEAKEVAKGILPTVGYSTLAGLGADAAVGGIMNKMRDTEEYKTQVDALTAQNTGFGMAANEARLAAEAGVRQGVNSPLAFFGGAAAGGILPAKNRKALAALYGAFKGNKLPSQLKEHAAGLAGVPIGAYGGSMLGSTAARMSAQIAEGGDLATVSPLLAPIDDTEIGRAIKEKAPGLAALPAVGALASLPVIGAYGARKYYGGNLSKLTKGIRRGRDEGVFKLLNSLDSSFVDRVEDVSKRNQLRSLMSVMNPGDAGYDEITSKIMEGATDDEIISLVDAVTKGS